MIELTPDARKCLDKYLGEMRASLAGCRSVDSLDVERDVTEHIEKSLAEAPSPVESSALRAVLEQLGSPSQWIPEEDLSWRRRLLLRAREVPKSLWSGPEDFRLAYLSIGLFALAILLPGAGSWRVLICVAFSFLFARAALAAESASEELGPQRWLLYPVLILVYFLLAGVLLSWIVVAAVNLADWLYHEIHIHNSRLDLGPVGRFPQWMLATHLAVTCTALWWFLLGLASWCWPALVRNSFYPFANGFRGRHGLMFAAFSLFVFVGGLAFGGWALSGHGLG